MLESAVLCFLSKNNIIFYLFRIVTNIYYMLYHSEFC